MPPAPPASAIRRAIGTPAFVYGTAWKKDATASLVAAALAAGFVAVDTAAQPRHYQEPLVGQGIRDALSAGRLAREQIYVQTKFTAPAGQDPDNMPYSPEDPVAAQVHASVRSSLVNLAVGSEASYIDCLLLHSPLPNIRQTLEAWRAMETYVPHQVRQLGISNVSQPILEVLCRSSTVKPAVVQNRFYAATGYDVSLRHFCREHGIVYESFWTLTGNPQLLQSTPVFMLAQFAGVSAEVALYALVMAADVVVLNGTTNAARMREDLEGIQKVQAWSKTKEDSWNTILGDFKHMVGDGEAMDE
ncbi:aldo-keto reductase [Diplodia corticola]|uniref:Aldo-keto reductase n=1 Tax=Diplodia corticola TaxID=236234 RepID=A0A1J9RJE4_9PEZI|nr:aldo-keto reductase [Diplodia corticola]OJD28655.1 aldo-keto reductase [Diplodia corticola]